MKIVITSDWHLDARTSGFPRWNDVVDAVGQTIELVKSMQADVLMMLGDLCDPDSIDAWRAASYAATVSRRLLVQDVDTVWVAGNHDVVEDGHGTTVLDSIPASHVITTPTCIRLGRNLADTRDVTVVVLPYCAPEVAYNPDEAVQRMAETGVNPVMVVGHLNIRGATPGSEVKDFPRGREVMWPTDTIRKVWPTAVMIGGHYHAPGQIDGVNIVGSLVRLGHGEEKNEPCVMVMDI